ncbi:hypothetical protein K8R47_01380 [archaeon]|nr:hypothetical protein [archaeon]
MKKVLILLIFLVLFVYGCSPGGRGLATGPEGLDITFLDLQPPGEVREDQQFNIGLNLINNAECDISGEICVKGTLTGFEGLTEDCKPFNLAKAEEKNNVADFDSDQLYFTSIGYSGLTRDLSTTVIAEANYNCHVVMGPQLCIKSVLGEDEQECPSTETISWNRLNSKVAPVTVTKVVKTLSPESSGVRLDATITLKKMRAGEIVSEFDEGDYVNIDVSLGGYGILDCDDVESNVLEWDDDDTEKVINCNIFLGQVDYLEIPLDIDLDYNYLTKQTKQINIENRE